MCSFHQLNIIEHNQMDKILKKVYESFVCHNNDITLAIFTVIYQFAIWMFYSQWFTYNIVCTFVVYCTFVIIECVCAKNQYLKYLSLRPASQDEKNNTALINKCYDDQIAMISKAFSDN